MRIDYLTSAAVQWAQSDSVQLWEYNKNVSIIKSISKQNLQTAERD